jgi:hypothetical protein
LVYLVAICFFWLPFGLFGCHLVCLVAIWYSWLPFGIVGMFYGDLVYIFPCWYVVPRKIWLNQNEQEMSKVVTHVPIKVFHSNFFPVRNRVTRWIFEKVAQNVAQNVFFFSKWIPNIYPVEKNEPKIFFYFCNVQKATKRNNDPKCKNSANLVGLVRNFLDRK